MNPQTDPVTADVRDPEPMPKEWKRRHTPIRGPMPKTSEWNALHDVGSEVFTASSAAALVRHSEHSDPLDLYNRYTGIAPGVIATEVMLTGTDMEPVIKGKCRREKHWELLGNQPLYFHPDYPFLGATPDVLRADNGNPVELKASTFRIAAKLGEEGSDWVPNQWFWQVQQQMLVLGADSAEMAVFLDIHTMRYFRIDYKEECGEAIIEAAQDMLRRLKAKDPPEPDWTHPKVLEVVKTSHGLIRKTTELGTSAAILVDEYRRLGEVEKETKAERKKLQAQLLHLMGDAAVGRIAGYEFETTRTEVAEAEVAFTRKASVRFGVRKRK
jgi:predicted phage-related endonuclease